MNARYSPSVVKTGWLSKNRPSVTSDDRAVRDPGQPDPGERLRPRLRPGQPGRVGRPGDVLDFAVVVAGELGRLARLDVDRAAAGRRRRWRRAWPRPATTPGRGRCRGRRRRWSGSARPARRRSRRTWMASAPLGVGDPGDRAGLAEHAGQPGAGGRVDQQRPGRAVVVREPVHGAAHGHHARLAGLVAVEVAQVVVGGDQLGRAGGGRGGRAGCRACAAARRRRGCRAARCRPPGGRRRGCRRWRGCGRRTRRGRCACAGRCRRARPSRCCRCPRGRRGRPGGRR